MTIKKYIPAFFSGFDDEYYEVHSRDELLNSELCKNWINSGFQICFSKDNDLYGHIMAISPANNEDGAEWYVVSIINNKQDVVLSLIGCLIGINLLNYINKIYKLIIMNYEKKYKEALKWVQKLYPSFEGWVKEDAEHYFPELIEDEDERTRKAILELVRQSSEILGAKNQNNMIAWLEKQGENKSDFSNIRVWKYIVAMVLTEKDGIGQYLDNPDTERIAKKLQERYGNIEKQDNTSKTSAEWSEDDKQMILSIEQVMNCASLLNIVPEKIDNIKSWLKSLRP